MITKNEEKNIAAALESARGVADEIILVDSFSTDKTVEIAKSYGAKIIQKQFVSFTDMKGTALASATKDWALNLDADEKLSDGLKKEILETVKTTKNTGFYLPSLNTFLGREMKHSFKQDYKLRLSKREGASYKGGLVHEVLTPPAGEIGHLKNYILHTPYRDIAHYFEKFNIYTSLGARSMAARGKKFNLLHLLARQPLEFIKIHIFRLAILDGMQGFLWALFSSFYPVVKYAKLWEINRKK